MKDTNDHNNTTACDASRFALVELHLHVDGSLSADDVMWMAKEEGIDVPSSREELRQRCSRSRPSPIAWRVW